MTPDDVRALAAEAVEDARMRLLERGLPPDGYPRLLEALWRAVEQVVAARELELGDDVESRRRYLDAVLDALDATPIVDRPPQPPRRTLALRW
jgi:hypothetical protein